MYWSHLCVLIAFILIADQLFYLVMFSLCSVMQMLEGLVRKIALELDVENIAKAAKASKEAKIAEIGADIEVLTKQS